MAIKKFLEVSSKHLTQKDDELLNDNRVDRIEATEWDEGYKVEFYGDWYQEGLGDKFLHQKHLFRIVGFSETFLDIMEYCVENKCEYVAFLESAEVMKEFMPETVREVMAGRMDVLLKEIIKDVSPDKMCWKTKSKNHWLMELCETAFSVCGISEKE